VVVEDVASEASGDSASSVRVVVEGGRVVDSESPEPLHAANTNISAPIMEIIRTRTHRSSLLATYRRNGFGSDSNARLSDFWQSDHRTAEQLKSTQRDISIPPYAVFKIIPHRIYVPRFQNGIHTRIEVDIA
jgi:hypothetical protein